MKKIISIFLILISIVSVSFAHSGRTDKYGGHYDRSTGTYHYHNGGYATSVEEDSSIDEDEQEDG